MARNTPPARCRGLSIFLRERDDPWALHPPLRPEGRLRAVYLERFLPAWLEREPDNPFLAALAPLILTQDAELQARAPTLWQTIQTAPVPAPVREALAQILEFWLFERFKSLTAREIWTMLNVFTPLEQTRAYQSIFIEGKTEGKAEGKAEGKTEGKAEGLKQLLTRRFGRLPPGQTPGLTRPASTNSTPGWTASLTPTTWKPSSAPPTFNTEPHSPLIAVNKPCTRLLINRRLAW